MKRKLSIFLAGAVTAAMVLSGCSSASGTDPKADAKESAADDKKEVVNTVGPDSGTHMNMWSFVELHNTFYADMLERWNKENPDRQIQITFTTYPFADMHNKLIMALQTGQGAPDLCDVEIGQFPNFLQGDIQLYPLNDAMKPYEGDLVQSRLDVYSKDGNYYGAPTHVGATVMYYNTEILDQYGIDYTKIKTWDDYTEAGRKINEASDGKVKMTSVDTAGIDWLSIAMSEYGEDWAAGKDGTQNVELESVKNMLTMQQTWLTDGIAMISPAGHIDLEEGYQNILDGNIASFPKALWYMSRFLNYMPEMKGKIAMAPLPVFKEGQNRSVGIGGTGTVVTKQSSDPELAADFITYAKCSSEGSGQIWEQLGFDVCNTKLWTDDKVTKNSSNKYISFFKTNPFDVLNEIKSEINTLSITKMTPSINDYFCTTTLNEVLEDGKDVDEALKEAQDYLELEE
ncbi:extracellular solute-binding protein [Clostridium boliviensis]|uniref:Extracellular solute-binding protein n=1 Tax=Clostridium boliviensis TaxID=318465 RepID=A0ABU4GII1_9CLOT|nr:extracellular solute-binding protein [Clostridium boliviensis]MDW2797420.1 extracellular solute-binding protein [Clostridium boliviensis]